MKRGAQRNAEDPWISWRAVCLLIFFHVFVHMIFCIFHLLRESALCSFNHSRAFSENPTKIILKKRGSKHFSLSIIYTFLEINESFPGF
jgi:hypothetical protein